jgi:hypothetical protein
VVNGVAAYIDREIAAQFTGSMKAWVISAAGGIIAARAGQIVQGLAANPALAAMGLVDGEMIDEELIYSQLIAAAQKGTATVELPVLGAVTFGVKDVEALHRYIIGG